MKYEKKGLLLVLSILISLIAVGFGNAITNSCTVEGVCVGYADATCFYTWQTIPDGWEYKAEGYTSCYRVTQQVQVACYCKKYSSQTSSPQGQASSAGSTGAYKFEPFTIQNGETGYSVCEREGGECIGGR